MAAFGTFFGKLTFTFLKQGETTMNCKAFRQQIDVLAQTAQLASPAHGDLAEHLRGCELCRHYYDDARLTCELQAMDVPEPDAAFVARSIEKAVNQTAERRRFPPLRHVTAVAASALLAVTLGLLVLDLPGEREVIAPSPAVAATYERKEIKVVIYSKEDHASAEFSIELAENLELEGYGGRQAVTWNGRLNKGANLLTLPVLAKESGGELRVTSRFGEGSHQVNVSVSGPAAPISPGVRDEAAHRMFQGVAG